MKLLKIQAPVLLLLLFLVSCDKGYQVRVTNYYIEPMDSVIIGSNKVVFRSVALETTTEYNDLSKGKYPVQFVTKSKKRINSSITIPSKGTGKRTIQIDAIEQINVFEE